MRCLSRHRFKTISDSSEDWNRKPNKVQKNGGHALTWAWLLRGTAATKAQVIMKKTKRFMVFEKKNNGFTNLDTELR